MAKDDECPYKATDLVRWLAQGRFQPLRSDLETIFNLVPADYFMVDEERDYLISLAIHEEESLNGFQIFVTAKNHESRSDVEAWHVVAVLGEWELVSHDLDDGEDED